MQKIADPYPHETRLCRNSPSLIRPYLGQRSSRRTEKFYLHTLCRLEKCGIGLSPNAKRAEGCVMVGKIVMENAVTASFSSL